MNLVCNTELTTQGSVGQCECRPDMRWNTAEGECQFFLDVDCSSFTYDTKPSANILAAVDRATASIPSNSPYDRDEALVRTESREETLGGSLLSHMGQSPSQADLREAFCRDIDAYSFEFNKQQTPPAPSPGLVPAPVPGPAPGGPRDGDSSSIHIMMMMIMMVMMVMMMMPFSGPGKSMPRLSIISIRITGWPLQLGRGGHQAWLSQA